MKLDIIVPIIILALFIIIYTIKQSNNEDIIKENCKSKEQLANINNAKKVFSKTKVSNIVLILDLLILIIFLICDFTSLDAQIIDYISSDFYTESDFDRTLYFIPIYIYIARLIYNQVKYGEFLLKFFNVKEPVLEENLIKTLLYKKKPSKEDSISNIQNKNSNENNTKPQASNTNNKETNNINSQEANIINDNTEKTTTKEEAKS